jgi:F-type H+-transporting ATPase subunit b
VIHNLPTAILIAADTTNAADESNNPLLPNLAELVVGTLAFLIMFGFLAWKVFPKISATYAERADKIEGGLARAEKAQAEAQATLEEYRQQLAQARHEASQLREEARAQGQAIIDEMRARAQEEADRIVARGHETIEAERQQAVVALRAEVGRLAIDLAGRIVGESLEDEARQRRTVDRFLAELESAAAQAGEGTQPAGAPEQVH